MISMTIMKTALRQLRIHGGFLWDIDDVLSEAAARPSVRCLQVKTVRFRAMVTIER